jgi:hypothetical protein
MAAHAAHEPTNPRPTASSPYPDRQPTNPTHFVAHATPPKGYHGSLAPIVPAAPAPTSPRVAPGIYLLVRRGTIWLDTLLSM